MRMTLKSVAIALALVTSSLAGTAVPAASQDGYSNGVVLVHDSGRRHWHDRERYERRHHRDWDRRDRWSRYDRYDRRDRWERRHARYRDYGRRDYYRDRGDEVVIRLR